MKGSKVTPITIILDILAVIRLTRLINEDVITEPLRNLVWSKFPPNTKLGYILTCPWCMSIWAALAITILRHTCPTLATSVSTILAASLATGYTHDKI